MNAPNDLNSMHVPGSAVTVIHSPPVNIPRDDPARFINRELSWLAFNRRVVEEAENHRHPLQERLRFVAISASNLDEFYSVRVAGLIGQAKAGFTAASQDGRTPAQQLAEVETEARALMGEQQRAWRQVRTRLAEAGMVVTDPNRLSDADCLWLDAWFMERVFPVLTPLAIDPAHPFPFIPNMGLVMALRLLREEDGQGMRALIPLPAQIGRFIRLPADATRTPAGEAAGPIRFVLLEDLVRLSLHRVFPGYRVLGQGLFRLIRDTDVEFEDEAEDLVRSYESALKRRRRGVAIHLALDADMPEDLRDDVRDVDTRVREVQQRVWQWRQTKAAARAAATTASATTASTASTAGRHHQ